MACIFRVELVYRDLLVKEACEELSDEEKEALPLVAEAYSKIRKIVAWLIHLRFSKHV